MWAAMGMAHAGIEVWEIVLCCVSRGVGTVCKDGIRSEKIVNHTCK